MWPICRPHQKSDEAKSRHKTLRPRRINGQLSNLWWSQIMPRKLCPRKFSGQLSTSTPKYWLKNQAKHVKALEFDDQWQSSKGQHSTNWSSAHSTKFSKHLEPKFATITWVDYCIQRSIWLLWLRLKNWTSLENRHIGTPHKGRYMKMIHIKNWNREFEGFHVSVQGLTNKPTCWLGTPNQREPFRNTYTKLGTRTSGTMPEHREGRTETRSGKPQRRTNKAQTHRVAHRNTTCTHYRDKTLSTEVEHCATFRLDPMWIGLKKRRMKTMHEVPCWPSVFIVI